MYLTSLKFFYRKNEKNPLTVGITYCQWVSNSLLFQGFRLVEVTFQKAFKTLSVPSFGSLIFNLIISNFPCNVKVLEIFMMSKIWLSRQLCRQFDKLKLNLSPFRPNFNTADVLWNNIKMFFLCNHKYISFTRKFFADFFEKP